MLIANSFLHRREEARHSDTSDTHRQFSALGVGWQKEKRRLPQLAIPDFMTKVESILSSPLNNRRMPARSIIGGNKRYSPKINKSGGIGYSCQGLDPFSWEFPRCPVKRYSLRGHPFVAWVPTGMPRIPDRFLDCVFYLYPSEAAARDGEKTGGTGFIAAVESATETVPAMFHLYAVSAKHVACTGGASFIRVNTQDGKFDILPFEPHEWMAHPGGDDVAVVPIELDVDKHGIMFCPDNVFLTEANGVSLNVGPGDDIVMIGRFINHEGKERNEPSVRFGNISVSPRAIRTPQGFDQLSYAVEMRSMAGYSGSPVFIYRTPASRMGGPIITTGQLQIWLLGVNWGYITDDWEITRRRVPVPQPASDLPTRDAEFVRANTGMNGVVPAWKILDLLHLPQFREQRAEVDKELALKHAADRGGTEFASAPEPPAMEGNPSHKEDFSHLVSAAARKRPPADQT